MNPTWLSTDEVLKDLAATTGRRHGTLDGHYVRGNAPPPRLFYEDDMEAHFGNGSLKKYKTISDTMEAPDLHGITSMLRMVQDYDSHASDSEEATDQNYCITITKTSKLNPNVKEFVPRTLGIVENTRDMTEALNESNSKTKVNAINSVSEDHVLKNDNIVNGKYIVNENLSDKTNDIVITKVSSKETASTHSDIVSFVDRMIAKVNADVNDVSTTKNIDPKVDEPSKNVTPNKCKEKEISVLKKKISEASKSDCFENKKQKNVAIATLLRLYAAKNDVETPGPMKLKTPDDFKLKDETQEVKNDVRMENQTPISLQTSLSSSCPTPEPRTPTSPVTGQTYTVNSHATSTQSISSPEKVEPTNDALVKKAIEKVNLWFEPVKKKSPSVYLSPVSFKKREPITSPVAETIISNDQEVKPNHPQQYRPSSYASDLAKKYMDQSKQLNDKKRNIWNNLEQILKEKDCEIKRKKEQESSSNNDSDGGSGP